MEREPKSAIRPALREEVRESLPSKPRQMSDGSVKVTVLPSNNSTITNNAKTVTTYSEHRSSSMSTSSSGQILLNVDPNVGLPAPRSPGLKRSSSWKKFKNTVKETVSGIVNLSVGQTSSTEELVGDNNLSKQTHLHLSENVTPDVEQKLIHGSTEDIFQPQMEEVPSALEQLEQQADAAFAAAANLPAHSTPIMVTLPPTVQANAAQLPNLPSKQAPASITAVPQIVVTVDTPVETRRDLQVAAMSSPRKILKNVEKGGENIPVSISPVTRRGLSSDLHNSTDKSNPLSFSNSMTNVPNLSSKRVSWGDVPPEGLPEINPPTISTNEKTTDQKSSTPTTDEEKKRAARLKIKNALIGAAASAGNDNLSKAMQAHLSSPSIPIQQSASTSNIAKVVRKEEVKTISLIPDSDKAPTRVRRSSDCGLAEDETLGQSPKGNGAKIGRASSMRKSKPKPMIWEHFDAVPNNSLQGRCKACHMTISCKHNTGQFVRHLQLAHMDIFRKYENKIQTEWTKSIVQRTTTQK